MSKTSLMTANGNSKHQDATVSVHSKWSHSSEKNQKNGTSGGYFKAGGDADGKRDNAWGPLFKSREHFNEMHMF